MKDDWRIKDFTEWDIGDKFYLEEAAYLYYEADPQEKIPDEVRGKIKKMYGHLQDAVRRRTFYRPKPFGSFQGPMYVNPTEDPLDRDDFKYFFFEKLGKKPKFLFPEERKEISEIEEKKPQSNKKYYEDFIRKIKVSPESDHEIKIQVPGKPAKNIRFEIFGCRNAKTNEWETLLAILRATDKFLYSVGATRSSGYGSKIKILQAIDGKFHIVLMKEFGIDIPSNIKIYENCKGEKPGLYRLKFFQDSVASVLKSKPESRKDFRMKELLRMEEDPSISRDVLVYKIDETIDEGIMTKEEIAALLSMRIGAMLHEEDEIVE